MTIAKDVVSLWMGGRTCEFPVTTSDYEAANQRHDRHAKTHVELHAAEIDCVCRAYHMQRQDH